MKHIFTPFTVFCLFCVTAVSLAWSGGATANSGRGFTGAPVTSAPSEQLCSTCHSGGNFGNPDIKVLFAEDGATTFNPLTSYVPGQKYQVSVAVGHGATAPQAYGFQAQFLKTTDNSRAGILAVPGAGVQISDSRIGRQYAEHSGAKRDSIFNFEWTAPATGTGAVNMYLSGNLVNLNGGITGDNGSTSPTIVALTEGTITSVRELTRIPGRLFPNPVAARSQVQLDVQVAAAGDYALSVVDVAGRTVQHQELDLTPGAQSLYVATERLHAGVYTVTLTGSESRFVSRLVVR